MIWEFPKIRGTLIWGPYNQDTTSYIGNVLGSPIFGNIHMTMMKLMRIMRTRMT